MTDGAPPQKKNHRAPAGRHSSPRALLNVQFSGRFNFEGGSLPVNNGCSLKAYAGSYY